MNIHGVNQVKTDFANGGYYKTFSFNDITSGCNGGFNASFSWDAVTGMGSFAAYTPNGFDNETSTFLPSTTFTSSSADNDHNTTIELSSTDVVTSLFSTNSFEQSSTTPNINDEE